MSILGEQSRPINLDNLGGQANNVLIGIPCASNVATGNVVLVSGGVASHAIASSFSNSNFIGIVEEKISTITCNVRVAGLTEPVFTGLSEASEYYLSDVTPGLATTSIPVDSGTIVVRVGQPFSATEMVVNKGDRVERT